MIRPVERGADVDLYGQLLRESIGMANFALSGGKAIPAAAAETIEAATETLEHERRLVASDGKASGSGPAEGEDASPQRVVPHSRDSGIRKLALDALDRLDHEVRQIILRYPVPKIGRKQKSLVPHAVDKFSHGRILTENHPKARQSASSKNLSSAGSIVKLSRLAAVLFLIGVSGCAPDPAPATAELSGNLPLSVNTPTQLTPVESRPYFDQFSWQSFIALNWPADPNGEGGVPLDPSNKSTFRNPPPGTTTVWESYKESFQLFGTGDQIPNKWINPAVVGDPCKDLEGHKTLRMVAKAADVLDEVNEAFSFPLIDQNKNYVYAEVRFNKSYYNFVRQKKYYLKKNLPPPSDPPMQLPATTANPKKIGAIMIKASWRFMTEKDDPSRYYVINALVANSIGDCMMQSVGLVGLHIAQKLKQFPEWVWSSFEQVDNVQRGPGASATTPISFNNGTTTPATPNGWANRPPKAPPLLSVNKRIPVQVTRYNPIPTTPEEHSTVDINTQYQALLAGTPWAFYQLVITQWPSNPSVFKLMENGGIYPKDSGQAFPINGAINTSLETFLQSQTDAAGAGGNSCMKCHYRTGTTDFSWIMQNKSH